jgi:outer membrane receptor protein involved in Fe transport
MKRKQYIHFLALVLFALSAIGFAGTTGKLAGQVVDKDTGEPLIGANLQLVDTFLGAATDVDGNYVILQVPPGTYTIEVSYIGYHTQKVQNVQVSIDLTTRLRVELVSETIELEQTSVIAVREMVTKDMTASQSVVGKDEIENLPVQELEDVLEIQAGVTKGRDGGLHIRGGRTDEVSYMVDGVPVSDGFSGNISVEVENSSVKELQVISGTFNAEYGRALSGIVNIVTKDGGDKFAASASVYSGDFMSGSNDYFQNISDFDPVGTFSGQVSLEGPVPLLKDLSFFASGRYFKDDGYIMARREFNPSDSSNFSADNPDQWYIERTGDGSYVPFRNSEKYSLLGKLSYRLAPQIKLTSSLLLSSQQQRDWSNEGNEFTPENQFHDFYHFMLNPDGASQQYSDSYTWITSFNHAINATTFYNANFTYIDNQSDSYAFEDPFDSRYLNPNRLENISYGNAFYTGGVDPWQTRRSTRTGGFKFDLTSQLNIQHQIKTGIEYRVHKLNYHEFKIIPAKDDNGIENSPFQPAIPDRISPFNNAYEKSPREFALYVQDKMEFENMIVNMGLRYDYFDPNANIPTDYGDPANPAKFEKASIKHQVSPRLGIAIPYSATGVLRFSYGYFFQMPLFQYLYANSEFEVEIGRLKTLMGNADLNPQKTIVYEIGFQQELTSQLALDFTVYYKDMRNLLSTQIEELTIGADRYARYINSDFGNTRGFTLALNQRASEFFAASLDYTFQIAKGNASEPNASFIDRQENRETEKRLVPLDWDQRHTINFSFYVTPTPQLSFSLLGKFGSGLPYTPEFLNIRKAFENTGRSESTFNLDFKSQYIYSFAGMDALVFLKVLNLLDTRNEEIVYNDTGRAGYTISTALTGTIRGVNSLDDFFLNPSYHFSPPRQVLLGLTLTY